MAFIIGGKPYELSNREWMFPAKELTLPMLSQGKTSVTFKKGGLLGP
jgi:hypothetical protein